MNSTRFPRRSRSARSWHLLWAILCLAGVSAGVRPAVAGGFADIFRVMVPVTDRSVAGREAGFATAMKTALVRATGKRTAGDDPAFASLVAGADRYVQQYRYAADGRLSVGFDGEAIERWLTLNGAPVWGRTRPVTFVWLTVSAGAGGGVVMRDSTSDLKSAIDAAALARGIELLWPSTQDLQVAHLDYAALIRANPQTLAAISRRHGAEGVLIGSATDQSAVANVQWLFKFQTQIGQVAGAAEGVNLAADTYAALYAVSGAVATVDVAVDGIRDVRDYANVQRLFGSLSMVSHVAVLALNGDQVHFRLDVRGGAAPLVRTLALNGMLAAATGTAPGAATGAATGVGNAGATPELRFHLRR